MNLNLMLRHEHHIPPATHLGLFSCRAVNCTPNRAISKFKPTASIITATTLFATAVHTPKQASCLRKRRLARRRRPRPRAMMTRWTSTPHRPWTRQLQLPPIYHIRLIWPRRGLTTRFPCFSRQWCVGSQRVRTRYPHPKQLKLRAAANLVATRNAQTLPNARHI